MAIWQRRDGQIVDASGPARFLVTDVDKAFLRIDDHLLWLYVRNGHLEVWLDDEAPPPIEEADWDGDNI